MKKSGSDKATNKWNSIKSTTKILIRALFLPGNLRHATRWNANSTEMNIHFDCKSFQTEGIDNADCRNEKKKPQQIEMFDPANERQTSIKLFDRIPIF